MQRHGWSRLCATVVTLTALLAAPASATAFSTVTLHGDDREWVTSGSGDPTSWFFRSDVDTITAPGTKAGFAVHVTDSDGDTWWLGFGAPAGEELGVGTYPATRGGVPAGGASMDVSGKSRGCNRITGSFEIRDILISGGEVRRLDLRFVQQCEERDVAAFGEIRIGLDPEDPASRIQPRSVGWPQLERERPGTAVPVVVTQEAGTGVVGQPTLEGTGAGAFTIAEDECRGAALSPGDSCAVWVQPDPAGAGEHVAELHVPVGAEKLTTHVRAVEVAGRTRVLVRDRGWQSGRLGGDWWLDPSDSEFWVTSAPYSMGAWPLGGGDESWDFEIRLADGEEPTAGSTYQLDDGRRVDVVFDHQVCFMGGELTVGQLERGLGSRLEAFSAVMQLTCGGRPAIDALVEYRATVPEPAIATSFPFDAARTWTSPDDVAGDPVPEDDDGEEENGGTEAELPPSIIMLPGRPQGVSRPARPLSPRPTGMPPRPPVARPATALRTCSRDGGRSLQLRRGTRRGDRLTGTDAGDRILAGSGDDRVSGRGGGDCLDGGRGRDRLSGGPGGDVLVGGDDRDILSGDTGDDILIGGAGRDVLRCGPGDDVAIAGRDDRVSGCEHVIRT